MKHNHLRKPANGWVGQALIEYQVLVPLMAIIIVIMLPVLAGAVGDAYQTVNDCVAAAQEGTTGEDCNDNGGNTSTNSPTSNSTGSNDTDSSNSTGSSSNGSSANPNGSSTGATSGSSSASSGSSTGSGDSSNSDDGSNYTPNESPDDDTSFLSDDDDNNNGNEEESEDTTSGATVGNTECPADANFDGLAAGTVLSNQFAGMTITTHDPVNHPAMIFDTTNPTGGDSDLGTPHSDFGGPGHGSGGAQGAIGENSVSLGNVIIISEDADSSDPDDNANGGQIIFNFDYSANVSYVYFLDQDNGGVAATVTLYDNDGNTLISNQVDVPSDGGDNGVYRVDLDATGVYRMVVTLPGSGAIASVFFCEPPVQDDTTTSTGTTNTGNTDTGNTDTTNTDDNAEPTEESQEAAEPTFAVTGFNLIDADTNAVVGALSDGQTIDLVNNNYAISAVTSGSIGSVIFEIDNRNYRTESVAPYTVAGDNGGSYTAWDYNDGTYTFSATPYSNSGGNGDAGQSYSITLNIATAAPEAPEATSADVVSISMSSYDSPNRNNRWRGRATVTVQDDLGHPVEGATVRVDFSRGGNNRTCTTNSNGQCSVETNNIGVNRNDTVATIDTVYDLGSLSYDASLYSPNSATINQP